MMPWIEDPDYATDEEWEAIEKNNRKYKIKYFFKETIPDFFDTIKFRVKEIYWWFGHRIFPNHRYHVCPTGLKPGYYDIPELMIYVNFKFLERYIEDEDAFNVINWDSDEDHKNAKKELEEIYQYWKHDRQKLLDLEIKLYESLPDSFDRFKDKKYDEISKQIYELELKLLEEDKKYLKKLIDIKDYMWT